MASLDHPVVRLAILDFETDEIAKGTDALGAVCEHAFDEELGKDQRFVLVERNHIRTIISEHNLSAKGGGDPLRLGMMLGADWLLFGRIRTNFTETTVEASILEVSSGNVLLNVGVAGSGSAENTAAKLLALVRTNLNFALEAREVDRSKPAVAILTIKNTSRVRRLDYMLPIINRLLESAVIETGSYRILRRQQSGLTRKETELSFTGWTRPSDAVIARRADVVISVEMQEQYLPGLTFNDTPVELKARIERLHAKPEEIAVTGLVGKKEVWLRLFAGKMKTALCGDGKVPSDTGTERVLEASRLLEEAIGNGSSYNTFGTEAPNITQNQFLDTQIHLLEKALYLDPGLFEARYWLGTLLSSGFSTTSGSPVNSLVVMERAIRELELYLQNSRPDGFDHDLSKTSECMSRDPGALHEKAQHNLIFCYQRLWSFYDTCVEMPAFYPLTPEQKTEWGSKAEDSRRRMIELVTQYVAEPPRKVMPDHIYFLPLMAMRAHAPKDTKPWIDWFLFINGIYGKEHARYNVWCPFRCLSRELLRAGKPQEALEYYERGLKEHQHNLSDYELYERTLPDIYRALGKEEKAKEIENVLDGERNQKVNRDIFYELVSQWEETHATAAPPMPQAAMQTLAGFPPETEVLACASHRSERYYFVAGQGIVAGFGDASRRQNKYRFQQLFQQYTEGGALENLPIERDGKPARVTVILPLGDFIWFGTHEGLARFNPRTKAWRWFGPQEGLPTNYILSGTVSKGMLWFVGGMDKGTVAFKFNPETDEVLTYLPDSGLSLNAVSGIEVMNTNALAYALFGRLFRINLVSGKWEPVDVRASINKPVATAGEWGNGYDAATSPVVCGGRWWIGLTGGLAVMDTNAVAFRSIFSSGYPYRRLGKGVPASSRNCPLSGCVTALTSDKDLLWVACNGLAAYDPKQDTWYGPFSIPGTIDELVADAADVWILGATSFRVKRSDFLQAAKSAGLCRSTTAIQRENNWDRQSE